LLFSFLSHIQSGINIYNFLLRRFPLLASEPAEPVPNVFDSGDLDYTGLSDGDEMLSAILMLDELNVIPIGQSAQVLAAP
jgi:hypothetical protein